MQNSANPLVEAYVQILNSLSPQIKEAIIQRLSMSVPAKQPTQNAKIAQFRELYGSFQSEKTDEEIIAEIRQARTFTTEIEAL